MGQVRQVRHQPVPVMKESATRSCMIDYEVFSHKNKFVLEHQRSVSKDSKHER